MVKLETIFAALVCVSLAAAENDTTTNGTKTKVDDPAPAYPGVILLLATAFIMMIWYMAMAHVSFVRNHTWSLLTLSVSIFCAVSSNNFFKYIVGDVLGIKASAEDPGTMDIVSALLLLVVYWLIVETLLVCFSDSTLRLKGYGTIGGHIMGFQSLNLWTEVVSLNPFNTSPWYIITAVLGIYMVVMGIFIGSFIAIGRGCVAKKMKRQADKDRWHDQANDTGSDFVSLGFAFLLTTFIKFVIYGELDPALSDPKGSREDSHIAILATVSACLIIFGAVLTVLSHMVSAGMACVMNVLTTVVSTAAAMCMIDVFNWKYLDSAPSEVLGRMEIAFDISLIAAAAIFLLAIMACCHMKDMRALRGAFTGLGIAVGSSWEKTFDASVDSLDGFGWTDFQKACLGYALFWIVFPAWMVYILPKGDDDLRKEIKAPPPVWSFCCDHDPCPCDDSDAEDYEAASSEDDS